MQDFARPENYQGSNLMTIKKIAENIRLENNKTKQSFHFTNSKHETWLREEKLLKAISNHGDFQSKRTQFRGIKSKKFNYQKFILSTKPTKIKRESLLIDSDLTKLNEKITPLDTINNATPSVIKSQNVIPTTKFLFGMILSKKTEAAIKKKALSRFIWAIKMIRAWLRYLNHIIKVTHRQQQQYLYSIDTFSETDTFDPADSNKLKFNKHHFKASKEIELTPEMKKILTMHPKQRTEEQILTVMYGLSALSAFNEYPVHLKKKLCTVAYFRKIDPRRVIIRQGHVAEYFYFIISGTAIVTITSNDDYGQVRTVNSLSKGCSFGELALLHHSTRTASVVSKSSMQLLAIERNDFFYIFMHMSEFNKYPEHIVFIKDIPIFSHLNFDQLVTQPEASLCHFYKNLIVISANDIESEWVYIVKSGSCTVLKELQVPIEPKLTRENTMTLNDIKSKLQCFDDYHFIPMPLNGGDGNSKSLTRYMWRSPTMLKPGDYFYLKSEIDSSKTSINPNENARNYTSVFIKVADLVAKDIYGLSSVIFTSEDKVRTENMASVALVSNRAEMVLVSKKFLVQKANDDLIKDIRQGLTQYPSEQIFLDNYKVRVKWEKYKIQRYNSTLKKMIP